MRPADDRTRRSRGIDVVSSQTSDTHVSGTTTLHTSRLVNDATLSRDELHRQLQSSTTGHESLVRLDASISVTNGSSSPVPRCSITSENSSDIQLEPGRMQTAAHGVDLSLIAEETPPSRWLPHRRTLVRRDLPKRERRLPPVQALNSYLGTPTSFLNEIPRGSLQYLQKMKHSGAMAWDNNDFHFYLVDHPAAQTGRLEAMLPKITGPSYARAGRGWFGRLHNRHQAFATWWTLPATSSASPQPSQLFVQCRHEDAEVLTTTFNARRLRFASIDFYGPSALKFITRSLLPRDKRLHKNWLRLGHAASAGPLFPSKTVLSFRAAVRATPHSVCPAARSRGFARELARDSALRAQHGMPDSIYIIMIGDGRIRVLVPTDLKPAFTALIRRFSGLHTTFVGVKDRGRSDV